MCDKWAVRNCGMSVGGDAKIMYYNIINQSMSIMVSIDLLVNLLVNGRITNSMYLMEIV